MPLMKKKTPDMSKANPDLAMAYDLKRRNKRKMMANGGPINAKAEERPMPEQTHNDSEMASKNDNNKPLAQSKWTDTPTQKQATMNSGRKVMPIKQPRMVPSSVINTRLAGQEDEMISSMPPGHPDARPENSYNEDGADRQGPMSPSLKMKKMANGGQVSLEQAAQDDEVMVPGEESDDDQMRPSSEEIMANHAKMLADGGPVTPVPKLDPTKARDFSSVFKAEGGPVSFKDAMEDRNSLRGGMDMRSDDEKNLEHAASIAAAIMSKRKMMAEGGQVDIMSNNEEQPNAYYDANEDAAFKENYDDDMEDVSDPTDSNEHADSREMDAENEHDNSLVAKIMRKKKSSPLSR